MIQLWGRPNAYNVQKVMWMLGEVDLDFIQHDIGSNHDDLETANFKALNPHSRIPVLFDGDAIIWESNTIIRYLLAQYGTAKFATANPIQLSCIERWMDWELATLQPDFIGLFWCFYRTPEANRDSAKIDYHKRRCADHFTQLDQQLLAQPYLAGDAFSMADICCATSFYRFFEMGVDLDMPVNLKVWYDKMASRQAYRETIMVPFGDLKGRLEF